MSHLKTLNNFIAIFKLSLWKYTGFINLMGRNLIFVKLIYFPVQLRSERITQKRHTWVVPEYWNTELCCIAIWYCLMTNHFWNHLHSWRVSSDISAHLWTFCRYSALLWINKFYEAKHNSCQSCYGVEPQAHYVIILLSFCSMHHTIMPSSV